jgi:amino acid transporter
MSVAETPVKAGSAELKREVGFVGLIWASTGSIIGSGWLFGAQKALHIAGPAALISWVIGAVAIAVLALVHAELGGMYPVAGGTARFPHFAFGGAAGASFGWFSWLQAATVAPIEVSAVITYGTHYSWANGFLKTNETLTGSGLAVAVALMAVFVAINMLSVRLLAHTNSAATWWKVAVPLLTIFVLAIANFHPHNFHAADGFAPAGAKGILSAVATGGIIFALLGFEQADQLAGESKNPTRDIPRAIIGSIMIGGVVYIALQVVFIGALPTSAIPHSWIQTSGGYIDFTGPFAQVATLAAVGWLATILYIDAVISPGGTGLIYTTATSRVSYGLSRNGYFPKAFEWTTENRVPWFGLIMSFVVGCLCFLPFPSWQSLVGLITSASVLMYAGAPLALGAFRMRLPEATRPYRLPIATFLSPVAFAIANLLILWSGWITDWKLGVAILIGFVLLIGNRVLHLNPTVPELDLGSAIWLLPYLVGNGLIVFFSTFHKDSEPLGIWTSLVVSVVFSLIIYFWAMSVALPSERIQQMIDTVVIPEDSELAGPAVI